MPVVTASNSVSVLTATTVVTITSSPEYEFISRTITYSYDGLYRLTEADYSSGKYFQYAYDAVGNRTAYSATITNTVVTTYAYDAANRLVRVGDTDYTWSDAGRLLDDGTFQYTWDAAGRLITVTDGVDSLGFRYNGDGDRVARIVNGTFTTHTLDVALGLPEVIVEHDGSEVTRYLHLPTGVASDDGTWTYSAADGLGSARQRVDGSGQVLAVQDYRPFGSPLEGDGGAPYGFTGEWWEGEAGLLFLRARYYDAGTGRFLSQDPWRGLSGRSLTLNRYVYVLDNPVNATDPSGHRKCGPSAYTYPADETCDEVIELCRFVPNHPLCSDLNPGAYNPTASIGTRLSVDCSALNGTPLACADVDLSGPAKLIGSFLYEPIDWVVTGAECIQEGCNVPLTLGLTFLPGATPFWRKVARGGGRVVGRIGRPILRVCDSLVGRLVRRGVSSADGATHYLDDILRQLRTGTSHSRQIADMIERGEVNVRMLGESEYIDRFQQAFPGQRVYSVDIGFPDGNEIYLRASKVSPENVPVFIVHEGTHMLDDVNVIQLDRELNAYIQEAEFALRRGLPSEGLDALLDGGYAELERRIRIMYGGGLRPNLGILRRKLAALGYSEDAIERFVNNVGKR